MLSSCGAHAGGCVGALTGHHQPLPSLHRVDPSANPHPRHLPVCQGQPPPSSDFPSPARVRLSANWFFLSDRLLLPCKVLASSHLGRGCSQFVSILHCQEWNMVHSSAHVALLLSSAHKSVLYFQ